MSSPQPPTTGPDAQVPQLFALPSDIIAGIFGYLTVQDVFTLRLVSYELSNWIVQNSGLIARPIAAQTFPGAKLLLRPNNQGQRDFVWIRDLIPSFLAAVLLDYMRSGDTVSVPLHPIYGISCEDPAGDVIRQRLKNGFKLWNKLSNVSREVYVDLEDAYDEPDMDVLAQLEIATFLLRKQVLDQHSPRRIMDYNLVQILLEYVIIIPPHCSNMPMWDGFSQGTSHLNWYLLHEGPMLLWSQWRQPAKRPKNSSYSVMESFTKARRLLPAQEGSVVSIHRKATASFQRLLRLYLLPAVDPVLVRLVALWLEHAQRGIEVDRNVPQYMKDVEEHFEINVWCKRDYAYTGRTLIRKTPKKGTKSRMVFKRLC